jgi:cold shock CspA family protein
MQVELQITAKGFTMTESEASAIRQVTRLLPWEGYGFITDDTGREIHFNRQSVVGDGFDRLEEGMDVRFTEEAGEKGPQASTVARARRRSSRSRASVRSPLSF